MLKLSEIVDFLVYSNIYISLGAVSFTYLFFKISGIAINYYVLLASFFMAFAIYTLNGSTDIEEDALSNLKKVTFNKKYNGYLLVLALAGFVPIVILSFIKGLLYGLAVIAPFLIGVFYSKRWIPSKSGKIRLKDILFLKNIVVAATWAFVTIILPAVFLSVALSKEIYVLGFIVFFRIFIGALFFDIKDVDGDMEKGVKTVPITYGHAFTDKLLIFLNTSFAYALLVIYWAKPYTPLLSIIGLFTAIYGLFYLLVYKMNNIELNQLSYLVVDGEYIATGLFVYLITSF